jgi:hypothetical protein
VIYAAKAGDQSGRGGLATHAARARPCPIIRPVVRLRGEARLRLAALVGAGVVVVHELRYVLGHGDHSAHVMAEHGYAHVGFLQPVFGFLLALAFASLIRQLLRPVAVGADDVSHRSPLVALWTCAAVALLSIYVIQETIEALLTADHPVGVECILGHGGWWAIPLSFAIGLVVALLARGAESAIAWARSRTAPARPAGVAQAPRWALVTAVPSPSTGIARRLAPRAPPPFASV